MALIFVCLERDQQGSQAGRAEAMKEAFYHLLPTPVYFIFHFSRAAKFVFILEWKKRQSGEKLKRKF